MKKIVLILALCMGYLAANSQTFYKIVSMANHPSTDRPKDADFKPDEGYISFGQTKLILYDKNRNQIVALDCPNLNNKSLADLFMISGQGHIGEEPVNFIFSLKTSDEQPNVLRVTFPNSGKGVTYLLADL